MGHHDLMEYQNFKTEVNREQNSLVRKDFWYIVELNLAFNNGYEFVKIQKGN